MKSKDFNTYLWQINGVIIACLGIFLILAIIVGSIWFISQDKNKHISNVVSTKAVITEKNISMGAPAMIKGSKAMVLTLSSSENVTVPFDNSYTPFLSSSVRNFLFINTESRKQHWLLPTNENLILYREEIIAAEKNNDINDVAPSDVKAIAQLYIMTKTDTNHDNLINELDLAAIAISTADGKDFTVLIRNIDQFIGSQAVDNKYLLVFLRKSDLFYSSMIDLNNFTVVSKQQISLPSMTLALRQGI